MYKRGPRDKKDAKAGLFVYLLFADDLKLKFRIVTVTLPLKYTHYEINTCSSKGKHERKLNQHLSSNV